MRWAWVALAVFSAVSTLVVTGVSVGSCYDAVDPSVSYCTSEPLITSPGVWAVWCLWAVFVTYCVVRAMRRTRDAGD